MFGESKVQKVTDESAKGYGRLALQIGVGFLAFGFVLILGFALNTTTFVAGLQIIAMYTALGGACLIAGALVGFLFGLPKSGQTGASADPAPQPTPSPSAPVISDPVLTDDRAPPSAPTPATATPRAAAATN